MTGGVEPSTGGTTAGTTAGATTDATGAGSTAATGESTGALTGGESSGSTGTGSTGTTGEPEPLVGCEPVWPETGPVQGMTPIGELVLKFAAFDPDGCGSIESITLYLLPEMPALSNPVELVPDPVMLGVALIGEGWEDGWIGEGAVSVGIIDHNQMIVAEAEGTLKVESLDIDDISFLSDGGESHWLVGTLDVSAPGWALHGSFTAAICWMIGGFTLCP